MIVSYIGRELFDADGKPLYPDELRYPELFFAEVIFLEGVDRAASLSKAIYISNSWQEDFETMTLLIPDRDRENQEDFIWCLPIERQKWSKWFTLSEKFRCVTPDIHGGVRYMNRMEGKEVRTILVMPTEYQTDEDTMHACAFLRMVKQYSCRIYVVRCTDDPLSNMIHKIAGADPKMVGNVEEDEHGDQQEEK